MKKLPICLIILVLYVFQKSIAQPCNMQLGYRYSIYIFSQSESHTFKEIFGEELNPMFVNVVMVKDEEKKKRIDEICLKGKMETTIFIYPKKDKTKTQVFCNQQEYLNALKNKTVLEIEED